MKPNFKGTGVALVTPFDKNGNVDYKGLEKLVEHVISGGVNYLVALGTTGESVTLSSEEKKEVVNKIIAVCTNRVPIVLGLGGNNTKEVLEGCEKYPFDKIAAVLSVSPYYNKPTQEGIYQHYKAIADASPVPVILYNVPGRTSSNILPDTTLRLAHHKNIIGVKEASGNLEQIMRIIKNKPDDFLVISGDDALTFPIMALGGDGVISVIANALPKDFVQMVAWCMHNNYGDARRYHYKLLDITEQLFAEGNPGGIKAALKILGVCEDHLRLPLWNVSEKTYNKLKALIEEL